MPHVKGHYRNGHWVQPHTRRAPAKGAGTGLAAAILLVGGWWGLSSGPNTGSTAPPRAEARSSSTARVHQAHLVRVVDGDTIVARSVDGVDLGRVRILGIDAPEVDEGKCHADQAAAATADLLAGQELTLTTDPTQWERDVYDRLLVYVALEDGTDVGHRLLLGGHARQLDHGDIAYQRREVYQDAEAAAQDAYDGLWGACDP